MIALELTCAEAAHWTEQQYQQMLPPKKGGPQRLVLVADGLLEESSRNRADTNSTAIVGFLAALHLPPEWELENIVVASAARRMGLGKRLLNALLSAARETNSDAVFLEVRESNSAARSLYEKMGFELTGFRKAYYTNPQEDAVLYRLSLG